MQYAHARAVRLVAAVATFVVSLAFASAANAAAPTISGSPVTTLQTGQAWSFQPTASDRDGNRLFFLVSNKPAWASFSYFTGKLSGTPSRAATYSNIVIMVTDGRSRVSLPAFTLTVKAPGSTGTSNAAPVITGVPSKSVAVGSSYAFQPTATDANRDPLKFSIANKPVWSTFDASTGRLAGTPRSTNVGTTSNIVISVSDGKTQTALPAFALTVTSSTAGAPPATVGSATVMWTPPTSNTDGSALTNLAGYRIDYGKDPSALDKTVTVATPGVASYLIENLSAGTWYFAVQSYTTTGAESILSSLTSKTIQ